MLRFKKTPTKNHIFAVAAISCGLLGASPTRVAAQTVVNRSDWTGGVNLPSYVSMQIYVPKNLATKPPIVVSTHACQTPVSNQVNANAKIKAAADKNGFIMIFPDNQGQNCWDVGSTKALTHDGGGDPHAVAQMVRYALKKYSGDSSRVYALGGSSGGMMTQALLAIYPEMFVAGAPRAGVPCGCWAVEYDKGGTAQWSVPCANGTVSKTAQQWGDIVRAINPNYTGHRPRVQLMQGDADATISYKNMDESIKQWSNVLGLSTTPDSTAKITSSASGKTYTYNCKFWKNKCGFTVLESWFAVGQPHSMNYEEDAIMKFFGIDVVGGKDPELAACGIDNTINDRLEMHQAIVQSTNGAIDVYTLSGRSVRSYVAPTNTSALRNLSTGGVYIVSRKLSDGRTATVPIIKQ